jgi:hypothetical protein
MQARFGSAGAVAEDRRTSNIMIVGYHPLTVVTRVSAQAIWHPWGFTEKGGFPNSFIPLSFLFFVVLFGVRFTPQP